MIDQKLSTRAFAVQAKLENRMGTQYSRLARPIWVELNSAHKKYLDNPTNDYKNYLERIVVKAETLVENTKETKNNVIY
jgi:hypothetical protein